MTGSDEPFPTRLTSPLPPFPRLDPVVHSDFETWHAEDGMPRMRALSASLMLTDNNEFNGPLMLIPGSHQYFVPCEGETPENNWKRSLEEQQPHDHPTHDVSPAPRVESVASYFESGSMARYAASRRASFRAVRTSDAR